MRPSVKEVEQHYTVEEAAKLSTLSKSTVEHDIRSGSLHHCKKGRRVLISATNLLNYLNSGAVG